LQSTAVAVLASDEKRKRTGDLCEQEPEGTQRLPMKCLGLHPEALQEDRERSHRVGLFLQLDDLEAAEQVAKSVLGEPEIIVRRVVNRKQKPRRQQ